MFRISKKPLGDQRLSFYEDGKIKLSAQLTKAGVSIECNGIDSNLGLDSSRDFLGDVTLVVDSCPVGEFSFDRLNFPEGEWIYIGLNFFHNNMLFDAPVVCGRGSSVLSYLSYGQSFNLKMNDLGDRLFDFEKHSFENENISSIASFFSDRYPHSNLGLKITMGEPEKWKAAFLCLIRKSMPQGYIELDDLPEMKPQRSYWLRLMQNLGVVCAKAPRKKTIKLIEIHLDKFQTFSSLLGGELLINTLSGPSSIIPHKILK